MNCQSIPCAPRSRKALTFGKREEQIFLGREISKTQDYSPDTAERIDAEVKRLVMDNYNRAKALLVTHKTELMNIADELLTREVLDAEQIKLLARGLPLPEAPAPAPVQAPPSSSDGDSRRETPERAPIVPSLGKPVIQE